MPPGYSRLPIAYATVGTRVGLAHHARWVAPPGELLRFTLARDLAARIAPPTIVHMPGESMPARGGAIISMIVQRFLLEADGRVVLQATWTVQAAPTLGPAHTFATHKRSSGGYASATRAMSGAVARLARHVLNSLRAPLMPHISGGLQRSPSEDRRP